MPSLLARWLAALGLACLASSVLVRRRPGALPLPDRLARCGDDLQHGLYA